MMQGSRITKQTHHRARQSICRYTDCHLCQRNDWAWHIGRWRCNRTRECSKRWIPRKTRNFDRCLISHPSVANCCRNGIGKARFSRCTFGCRCHDQRQPRWTHHLSKCGSYRIDHYTRHHCGRLPLAPGGTDCTTDSINVGCKLITDLFCGICMIFVHCGRNKHRRSRWNSHQFRRFERSRVLLTSLALRLFPVGRQRGLKANELRLCEVLHYRGLRRWHTVFPTFTLLRHATDRQRHSRPSDPICKPPTQHYAS